MSMNFSANQLEREFLPRRLGNWQLPRRQAQRPRARRAATRVIADDRGHLLPGIHRSCRPPWGSGLAAWDFPRIPRRRATEVTEPQQPHLTSWEKRSSHVPLTRPLDDEATATRHGGTQLRTHCRHSGSASHSNGGKRRLTPHGTTTNNGKLSSPLQITGQSTPPVERQSRESNSGPHTPQETSSRKNTPPSPHQRDPPLATSYCSAQVARQHAQDNLRHRPLPDVVDDATYRALEARKHMHPGLSLDVEPKAAAVGWRGYGASGPMQCSKLRVYRPKTAGVPPVTGDACPGATEVLPTGNDRPSTGVDRKSRLRRQDNVSEMQLAICWDLSPPPEQGEPHPSPHIDGSNGSAAPAVFTLVHQPQPEVEQPCCGKSGGCSPQPPGRCKHSLDNSLASRGSAASGHTRARPRTAWGDKSAQHPARTDGNNNVSKEQENRSPNVQGNGMANTRIKENERNNSGSSRGQTSSADGRKRVASANNSASKSVDSAGSNASLAKQKHHQSSPNLAGNGERRSQHLHNHYVPGDITYADKKKLLQARPCIACELKSSASPTAERPRSDYKMAFKAGKPNNSLSSGPSTSSSQRPQTGKVRVPKPRAFLKRNYSIDTLAPPFSLWPGNTGQDYPEHWRLASVYQHAYKPIEARKKPLLASIYQ